jgi:endonuclease YncB( thermonuclease family)
MRSGLSIVAALALAGCVDTAAPLPQSDGAPECRVTEVVDGDTFRLSCGGKPAELSRLRGVDAPEIARANCPVERAKAQSARQGLERLVAEAPVTNVRFAGRHGDGRRLVDLEIGGRDVGQTLIAEGLARPLVGEAYPWWCGPDQP